MINSTLHAGSKYLDKLRQLHILLVEDNLLNAKLISILFAQYSIKLHFAAHGMEAVEILKANNFDIVLMDIEMPVMNGYQATTSIRQQLKSDVPIIALTAHALPGEMEKCLQAGMNAYICKPVDTGILLKTIYNLACNTKAAQIKEPTVRYASPVTTNKICNMDYLMGATRGNKKIMNTIVAGFFKETRKELVYLNDAIQKTNYTVISDISHKIKSAFSILGISLLEPVFTEMEQLSSSTSDIGKIEQLNHRINFVFKQARAELKAAD